MISYGHFTEHQWLHTADRHETEADDKMVTALEE